MMSAVDKAKKRGHNITQHELDMKTQWVLLEILPYLNKRHRVGNFDIKMNL